MIFNNVKYKKYIVILYCLKDNWGICVINNTYVDSYTLVIISIISSHAKLEFIKNFFMLKLMK